MRAIDKETNIPEGPLQGEVRCSLFSHGSTYDTLSEDIPEEMCFINDIILTGGCDLMLRGGSYGGHDKSGLKEAYQVVIACFAHWMIYVATKTDD